MPFSIFWVWALNALHNSMMFSPRWPSAGPIGGDGFAAPAGTCSLWYPVIFFAMHDSFGGAVLGGWRPPHLPRVQRTDDRRRTTDKVNLVCPSSSSEFLHLRELQFHRRRAAEDRDRHLQPRAGVVDLLHGAVKRGERPVGDAHLLADLERYRGLRTLDALLHLLENVLRLGLRDR